MQVVELYIKMGFITGMCGDGGNDCGALRAAHAGVALSEAEASVVSPFTSGTKSVQSVADLLCEGRCALATSFAAYRFYITYGPSAPPRAALLLARPHGCPPALVLAPVLLLRSGAAAAHRCLHRGNRRPPADRGLVASPPGQD